MVQSSQTAMTIPPVSMNVQAALIVAWVRGHETTPADARVTVKQTVGQRADELQTGTTIEILSAGRPRLEYQVPKSIDDLTQAEVDRLLAWHSL